MTIIVTGAAGFIGSHVCHVLLDRGEQVLGIDNLNSYYDPKLKEARLARLTPKSGFTFVKADIADTPTIKALFDQVKPTAVIHLAAQAGVRYSLENPRAYIESNIVGHLNIIEGCRNTPDLKNLVYASSSSVYGGNTKQPFSVADPVDTPVSLYAATKKSDELMTYCYSHLFKFPATGLRFFTVYGPWGRPDMAAYLFTDAIMKGQPINVFNHGNMKRDFTYIDDIVSGIIAALDRPPEPDARGVRHRVYNLGNHKSERLLDYISIIEQALGKTAIKNMMDMQPGDVPESYADIAQSQADLGYQPTTSISVGLPKFIAWYKEYNKIN